MQFSVLTLRHPLVTLEPLAHDHLDALGIAASDPRIWRYLSTDLRNSANRDAWLQRALEERKSGLCIPYAVRNVKGVIVGSTRYLNIQLEHRRLEIGWTWLESSQWGGPTNPAMKLIMLEYAFQELRANRVELRTDALNVESRAAISRLGATEEGILRHHMIMAEGRLRDTVQFAILKEQWPHVKARLEAVISCRQST